MIIYRTKYTYKCLELLQTNQFINVNYDPKKSIQARTQRLLRKFKTRMSQKQYYQYFTQQVLLLENLENSHNPQITA